MPALIPVLYSVDSDAIHLIRIPFYFYINANVNVNIIDNLNDKNLTYTLINQYNVQGYIYIPNKQPQKTIISRG